MSLSITNEMYNLTLLNNGKPIVVKAKTMDDITVYMYKNQKLRNLDGIPKTDWEMTQLRLLCGQAEENTIFHLFVLLCHPEETKKLQELRIHLHKQNIKFTFVVLQSESDLEDTQLLNVGFIEIYNTWKKGKQTDYYIPYFCTFPNPGDSDVDFTYSNGFKNCDVEENVVFDYLSFLRTNGYNSGIHKLNYTVLSKKKVNDVIFIKIFEW